MPRNFIYFTFSLLIVTSFTSCDDGDIIVTNFDFDSSNSLKVCRKDASVDTAQNQLPPIEVFYTINSEPDESLAISVNNTNFNGKFTGLKTEDSLLLDVNSSNRITYRTFNGAVGNDYFCRPVPPSQPAVNDEFVSTNGGKIYLRTSITEQDDNDDVPAEVESESGNNPADFDYDTDNDGIPNFLDSDDDNDNIPTVIENNIPDAPINADGYPDTDQDGTPDYLDDDDDGDGVLTRYEDLNAFEDGTTEEEANLDPLDDKNEDGVPNYRNPNATDSLQVDFFNPNIISRTFRTRIVGKNVTLKNIATDEQITSETLTFGQFKVSSSNEVLQMDLN